MVLRRNSSNHPWGITICENVNLLDAPIFIDSVTPDEQDPQSQINLLRTGDQILAINGIKLHSRHNLCQARCMMEHFADRLCLHIARNFNQLSTESSSSEVIDPTINMEPFYLNFDNNSEPVNIFKKVSIVF